MTGSDRVDEEDLRTMVREAIARHLSGPVAMSRAAAPDDWRLHASHGRLPLASGGEGDGSCLIEPSVPCTHCGYCQSYGH